MRDLLLTGFVLGSIPFILYRPHLGVLMYIWLSVMNPHRLTWSYAYDFGFAAVIAVATLLGALLTRERKPIPVNALSFALLLFGGWTTVTTLFALYPGESYVRWIAMMKTLLMAMMIPMLCQSKEILRQVIWVVVLSIAFYGTKGGIFIMLTGGALYRLGGPPGSYIEDNNALAVAIIMAIPLMRYLQVTTPHKLVRWALLGMMLSSGVAVLGTYSRGALLAIAAMLAFLWLKGRHKVAFFAIVIVAIPFALQFMPDGWYRRMDTIAEYQTDSSAMNRLNAWQTMFNIAKDRPLVGAGHEVATKEVFDRYSPDKSAPPQVAHSIYFEALGGHGFVGLALYLALLFFHWNYAGRLVRRARGRPDLDWAQQYGLMMQVSIVGYAVGGAFLSLINFDVPYYFIGATLVVGQLLDRQLAAEANEGKIANSRAPSVSAGFGEKISRAN